MDTKREYWKGDQIFNVPQRHVCWRLVLHMSQSWEVMGPFKKDWKLEVFRSLGFLHLGQSQDPQSCPFPTWHEVRDFCLPVGSFLEVCGLTTPQVRDNGTSQSWTRASKSVSQNTPLQMEHPRYATLQHEKSVEILWSLFWKGFCQCAYLLGSLLLKVWWDKVPGKTVTFHLSFLSHYPSLVYTKICFWSLVTKTVC